MSRHEGVSCDSCLRNNFKGRRYKCLVCFDYDLCGSCFESGAASARHVSSHAMQCMLPRAEYELYYAGESASLTTDAPLALTCPYCGRMGLTEAALYDHACCEHSDLAVEVVCPVCASQPGGEPNNLVLDFVAHIQREHRGGAAAGGSAGVGGADEGHGHPHGGHHGVPPPSHSSSLQIQQTGAQQPNGTSAQHDLRQQPRRMPSRGGTAGSGSAGLGSRTSRRHPQMAFTSMPLSPRDSAMESITELLSQLSGTRRATSGGAGTAAGQSAHSAVPSAQQTIQQLQMQLERQHSAAARQQLTDKLPRRTGGILDVGPAGGSGLLASHQQPGGSLVGAQDGGSSSSIGGGTGQSQFLLASYLNDGVSGSSGRATGTAVAPGSSASAGHGDSVTSSTSGANSTGNATSSRPAPDRAQFVENLLLNSLLPNSALWKLHCATVSSSQKQSIQSMNRSASNNGGGDDAGGDGATSATNGNIASSSSSSGNANTSGNNNNNNNSSSNASNSNNNRGPIKYQHDKCELSLNALQPQQQQDDNVSKSKQKIQSASIALLDQANARGGSSPADSDGDDWGDLATPPSAAAAAAAAASGNLGSSGATAAFATVSRGSGGVSSDGVAVERSRGGSLDASSRGAAAVVTGNSNSSHSSRSNNNGAGGGPVTAPRHMATGPITNVQ